MRSTAYEIGSLAFLLGSIFFLYRCVEFLAQKDYVAGIATLGIGFLVVRVGVELSRLSFYSRREEEEHE